MRLTLLAILSVNALTSDAVSLPELGYRKVIRNAADASDLKQAFVDLLPRLSQNPASLTRNLGAMDSV